MCSFERYFSIDFNDVQQKKRIISRFKKKVSLNELRDAPTTPYSKFYVIFEHHETLTSVCANDVCLCCGFCFKNCLKERKTYVAMSVFNYSNIIVLFFTRELNTLQLGGCICSYNNQRDKLFAHFLPKRKKKL